MAVRLEGIHFLVTYRCTYACDHCFVWGSPDAEGTMTLAQLTSVIDQAAELGVTDVYFEGGEPTLAYPVVLAAAQHAREHGLDVGIVSNCFWATSLEDAKVWLAPFAELGLADLSLSSYAYFVEDANEEHLRNAVLAAQELGIPVERAGGGGAGGHRRARRLLRRRRRDHAQGAGGRGARARASRRGRPRRSSPAPSRTSPTRAGLTSARTASCRSARASAPATSSPEATARRRPSTWPRRSPAACARVLDAYDPHARPVIREILAGGPWALAQAAGHSPERSHYADECHLCYEVRAALRAAGRHPDVVAPGQCYAENEPTTP